MENILLQEHKDNCAPLSESFHNPPHGMYAEMNTRQLRQWDLDELQDYTRRTTPADYTNVYGVPWSAPDCTIGIFRYKNTGEYAGFLPCGSWKCPACATRKKMLLIKNVNAAFADMPCFFLTLKVNGRKGHIFSDHDITKAFAGFRQNMHKLGYFRPDKGHQYFWVKEFTPPSRPYTDDYGNRRQSVGGVRHLHILTNFFIPGTIKYTGRTGIPRIAHPWEIWAKQTKFTTNQHGVDMTAETEAHGVVRASYMTKYITKGCDGETDEHGFQRYERRYGKSTHLFTMTPVSEGRCFVQFLKHGTHHAAFLEWQQQQCMAADG